MPTKQQIGFILFGLLVLLGWAWAASGLSFSAWWAEMECRNISHFATGAILGLIFWIFGLVYVQPKTGVKAAFVSFLGMVLASLLIEFWQLSKGAASDGFDPVDLLWAGIGWLFMQGTHLATHQYD